MPLTLGLGLGLSQQPGFLNIANPIPAAGEWTEISPGVWQCTGNNIGAATTLLLTQESDGMEIGTAYVISATIVGADDILIRSGSTTLDTNWDGSPQVFVPDNGNFNIFQRAGGYTISNIVIKATATPDGVSRFDNVLLTFDSDTLTFDEAA